MDTGEYDWSPIEEEHYPIIEKLRKHINRNTYDHIVLSMYLQTLVKVSLLNNDKEK